MTDLTYDDGPELVPPAELLELRSQLSVAPRPEVRRTHLDAVVAQVRSRPRTTWGRVAAGTARSAAAVVVTLTITSGLAAAQVLPEPAQKILSSVSDRITGRIGTPEAPEPEPEPEIAVVEDEDDATTATETTRDADPVTATTTVEDEVPAATTSTAPVPTTTTTTVAPTTTTTPTATTVPSPIGSGSEGDPTPPPTETEEPTETPTEWPESTDPNAPTEPDEPAPVQSGGTVTVVDDGGTVQEGDPG